MKVEFKKPKPLKLPKLRLPKLSRPDFILLAIIAVAFIVNAALIFLITRGPAEPPTDDPSTAQTGEGDAGQDHNPDTTDPGANGDNNNPNNPNDPTNPSNNAPAPDLPLNTQLMHAYRWHTQGQAIGMPVMVRIIGTHRSLRDSPFQPWQTVIVRMEDQHETFWLGFFWRRGSSGDWYFRLGPHASQFISCDIFQDDPLMQRAFADLQCWQGGQYASVRSHFNL